MTLFSCQRNGHPVIVIEQPRRRTESWKREENPQGYEDNASLEIK